MIVATDVNQPVTVVATPIDAKITTTMPAMPMRRYRYVRCSELDCSVIAIVPR